MTDLFLHERIYCGESALARLAGQNLVLCGAGALGSLLADNLVRQGLRRLAVIDDDRVELHNLGAQLYRREDVGAFKVEVLGGRLYRASGVEIKALAKRLDERTVKKLLRGAGLVVDAFDNSASRRLVTSYCLENGLACLHLGLNAGYGEVRWNETYQVPQDVAVGNACDYPLPSFALDLNQQFTTLDFCPGCDGQVLDPPRVGGANLVLHLHRFQD